MKKILSIICALVISASVMTFSGCTVTNATQKSRIEKITYGHTAGNMYTIVYDTQTGVEYFIYSDRSPIVLVNADGTPVVYKGE